MNGIKLFRVFGITVFLHWSWFLVAAFQIQSRVDRNHSLLSNVIEYLMLFAIVLMHEFGHALACRSVGGEAETIMLWPLGGVAYVNPPPRPGALLWSIAAGPLVNVALLLISLPLLLVPLQAGVHQLIVVFAWINGGLLIFNLLPIYPLDGGQILQSLLWFVMGRGRSMAVATLIGMIGAAGLAALAIYEFIVDGSSQQSIWLGVLAFFAASRCWSGWKAGVLMRERENAKPRPGFACPACGKPPVMGKFWQCGNCRTAFDTFETGAVCPGCGNVFGVTECSGCKHRSPITQWQQAPEQFPLPPTPVTPLITPAALSGRTEWM
jgi:Zn-dependent protease